MVFRSVIFDLKSTSNGLVKKSICRMPREGFAELQRCMNLEQSNFLREAVPKEARFYRQQSLDNLNFI